LEGVCPPATWTAEDHRGFTQVFVYQGKVTADAPADEDIAQLMADGTIGMEKVYEANIPRKPEWLGW
jgi:branched-chain amino acid transport system substrate-binding protein